MTRMAIVSVFYGLTMPKQARTKKIYSTEIRMAFTVTIHMVSSLDGYIAKKDNSVSWFETAEKTRQ